MELQKTASIETQEKQIQLVKGEFTPSEASDVIMALINQKINYHKLKGLQLWEKSHERDQEPINNRIKELQKEKQIATDFILKMIKEGKNLHINGTIEITTAE